VTELTAAPETQEGGSPVEPMSTAMPPDFVRNSPEYRELQRQNRMLARQKGSLEVEMATYRQQAEAAREEAATAEAAARENAIRAILGDEGVAAWAEIAELSESDPIAAARKFAEFQAAHPATPPAATQQEEPVAPAQTTTPEPPAPPRGLEAAAPLTQTSNAEDYDATANRLEAEYQKVVEQVQNPLTRNRVRLRDQASAFISYVGAAYLRAGARPNKREE
jgi:hypothetical protein